MKDNQIAAIIIGVITCIGIFRGYWIIPLIGMIAVCTLLKGCD